MTTFELVKYTIDDAASPALTRLLGHVKANDAAALQLAKATLEASLSQDELAKSSVELERRVEGTSQALEQMAAKLGLSSSKFGELASKLSDTDQALEEQTQKLIDARNYLDEYGATQEQQQRLLTRLTEDHGKYNLTLGKQALVLEELAIELQDTAQVEKHFASALEFTAKQGGRAEDALATFTEAVKGDTAALGKLGPVAASAAGALDQLRDRNTRAAETFKIFSREANRAPDALDRLNDQLILGQAQLTQFVTKLGPVGLVAGGVATVIGGTLVKSLDLYYEKNQKAAHSLEYFKEQASNLGVTLGGLVAEGGGFNRWLDDVGYGFKELAGLIGDTNREMKEYIRLGAEARQSSPFFITTNLAQKASGPYAGLVGLDVQNRKNDYSSGQSIEAAAEYLRGLERSQQRKKEIRRGPEYGPQAPKPDDFIGVPYAPGSEPKEARGPAREVDTALGGFFARLGDDAQRAGDSFLRASGALLQGVEALQSLIPTLEQRIDDVIVPAGDSGSVLFGAGTDALGGASLRQSDLTARVGKLGGDDVLKRLGVDGIGQIGPLEELRLGELEGEAASLNSALSGLATQGLQQVTLGLTNLFGSLAGGTLKAKDFGKAFLGVLGETMAQAGEGFLLLGLSTLQLQLGVPNPATLISLGAGLTIAGTALSGWASKSKGGSSSQESVTREAFRESTDRLLEERRERQPIVINNFFGQEKIQELVVNATLNAQNQGLLA